MTTDFLTPKHKRKRNLGELTPEEQLLPLDEQQALIEQRSTLEEEPVIVSIKPVTQPKQPSLYPEGWNEDLGPSPEAPGMQGLPIAKPAQPILTVGKPVVQPQEDLPLLLKKLYPERFVPGTDSSRMADIGAEIIKVRNEWVTTGDAILKQRLDELSKESQQLGTSFGYTEEELPPVVAEQLQKQAQEKPEEFLKDLFSRGTVQDREALLRYMGANDADIAQIIGEQERQAGLQELVNRVLPDFALQDVADFINTDPDKFIQVMQTGGNTKDKQDFLTAIGFTPEEIQKLLGTQKLVLPVNGIRKEVIIAPDNKAVDVNGNYLGMYDPKTRQLKPQEGAGKDIWDTLRTGFTETAYQSKQFFVHTLPEMLFPPPGQSSTIANILHTADIAPEDSQALRDFFRGKRVKNEQEHQDWIGKHPELQPRPEWTGNIVDQIKKNPKDTPFIILNSLASGAPATLAMISGIAASVGTGNPLPLLGSIAILEPSKVEGLNNLLLENGAKESQAANLAVATGTVMNALLLIPGGTALKAIAPKAFSMFEKEATEGIAKLAVQSALKQAGQRFTETEALMIVQGVAQQAIQNAAVKLVNNKQELFAGIGEAAIQSAIQGLPLAGIAAAGRPAVEQAKTGVKELAKEPQKGGIGGQEPVNKEPWQMTRDEFVTQDLETYREDANSIGFKLNEAVQRKLSAEQHEKVLRKALSEGKSVPPEVLKDYPDLAKAIPKAATVPEAVPAKVTSAPEVTLEEQIRSVYTPEKAMVAREALTKLMSGAYDQVIVRKGLVDEEIRALKAAGFDTSKFNLPISGKLATREQFSQVVETANKFLRALNKVEGEVAIPKAEAIPEAEQLQRDLQFNKGMINEAIKSKKTIPFVAYNGELKQAQVIEQGIRPEKFTNGVRIRVGGKETIIEGEGLIVPIKEQYMARLSQVASDLNIAKHPPKGLNELSPETIAKLQVDYDSLIVNAKKAGIELAEEAIKTPAGAGIPPEVAIKETSSEVEKAVNIRLDKFPEEVRDTIREWADTHPREVQQARRKVIPDKQVFVEAQRLTNEVGGHLDNLQAQWKKGQAWNAEELLAIRSVLSEKTKAVLDAQTEAKSQNSTENLLKLQLALKEQAAIQEMVHGLTAEAGRSLRSFRQEVFDVIQMNDAEKMEALLKRVGGREYTEKIAGLLSQVDVNDPTMVNKFIQDIYKPKAMDYITELFYNSILSGPKTHIVNSLSNTANALFSPIERAVSALVDLPLSSIQKRGRGRFISEVPADIFGAMRGIPEGFRQFAYVIKNGISLDQATKWEFRPRAFKGKLGTVIGFPTRMLEAADALMKTINQRAALNAEAHRIASQEGLKGQSFENKVAELLSNPTGEMLFEANKVAEYRLFRQEPGRFGQTLMNLRESVDIKGIKPIRFVIPFIRTPMNLVKYGLERTPLGFLNPKLWQKVGRKNPEAADQIARATIGSIGLATFTWYAAAGLITGAPPRDRAERERFYREGKQPFAIRVDGFWVSYQRLEPLNQLLSQVAILVEMIRTDDKDTGKTIADAVNTFGQNFVSQTYMSSVADLLNMLAEPERYAGNWLNRFASSLLVPMSAATKTTAQMLDNVVRDPKNLVETIEASIPGLSKNVQAKITALGEDVKRKSPAWFPISITPVEETILSKELERLKFDVGFAGKTISGIKLSEEEQRQYQVLSGQMIKRDLERLMVAPDYWKADDVSKDKMIQKIVNTARDWAKTKMREKMWTTGTTDERLQNIGIALKEADAHLGEVISDTPTFSHEPPNIYDLASELDASYRSLLEGIPEASLRGIKAPPTVHSWYERQKAQVVVSGLPNKSLIQLNADAKQGDTFEDFFTQWQKRSQITDDKELLEFDKKYPNANLGNFSRRELESLQEFHRLTGVEQNEFLEKNQGLSGNPKRDWLMANPRDNAQLALWGDERLLTKESYDEFNKLIKELDVPDSLIPKSAIPDNLPVFLLTSEKKFRDITNQIEDLKGLADEKVRKESIEKLRQTNVTGDITYRDIERKVEALLQGTKEEPTSEKIAEKWVERGKLQDQKQGFNAEDRLWLVDNPEVHQWALEKKLLSDDGKDWNVPALRIDVKYRKQDAQYNALPAEGIAREEYLADNPAYRQDRRRREAYQKGLGTLSVEDILTRMKKSHEDLLEPENQPFPLGEIGIAQQKTHIANYDFISKVYNDFRKGKADPTEIDKAVSLLSSMRDSDRQVMADIEKSGQPPENFPTYVFLKEEMPQKQYVIDVLQGKVSDQVENYVSYYELPDKGYRRERFLQDNPEFAQAVGLKVPAKVPSGQLDILLEKEEPAPGDDIRIQAYKMYVPDNMVEDYVVYKGVEKKGYEDDWWMMEHPDFYKQVYLGIMGNKRKDYREVPTRQVFAKYEKYLTLASQQRENFRFDNPDLEDWLLLTKKVSVRISEKRRKETLSPQDLLNQEVQDIGTKIKNLPPLVGVK